MSGLEILQDGQIFSSHLGELVFGDGLGIDLNRRCLRQEVARTSKPTEISRELSTL